MNNFCEIKLIDGESERLLAAECHKVTPLPRLESDSRGVFIGWSKYAKLDYGFMNYIPSHDDTLHAIRTDAPVYTVESHFRGDVENSDARRCQFRRYVVDIYLENSDAQCGKLKLVHPGHLLYYLGHVPVDGVSLTVSDKTEKRGGAYYDAAFFTTSELELEWRSESVITDCGACAKRKIATLMLCFGSWGMSYGELARRTSDDILTCDYMYESKAGDERAYVSANFYGGVRPELLPEPIESDSAVTRYDTELPESEKAELGELLTRYAILSDSHVGVRYAWENYDWLHGVYNKLAEIHASTPLDFVVELGDNIDDGYAKTWQTDYAIYLEEVKHLTICDPVNPIENRAPGTIAHYELQGNHDTSDDTRFFKKKLWYTESATGKKTAHIAFYTNYGGYPAVNFNVAGHYGTYRSYGVLSDDAVSFVENSIREAKAAGACGIVLYNHFGIAPDLLAPVLPESGLGKIEPICGKEGIKLYFSGHEHNPEYALKKSGELYNFDAAMTHDAYATAELYEHGAIVRIYDTDTNELVRVDRIRF